MRPTLELLEFGLRCNSADMPASVRSNGLVELIKILPRTVPYACDIGDNDIGLTAVGAAVRVWCHCYTACDRSVCVSSCRATP